MNFTRTRSRDSKVQTYITLKTVHYQNDGRTDPPVITMLPANTTGTTESMSDVSHKGYSAARKRAKVIMGDLLLDKTNRTQTDAAIGWWNTPSMTATYYDGDFAYMGESNGTSLQISESDIARLRQVVLSECYAKMNQANILGGEFAATMEQTVAMFRRPFSGAQDLIKRMIKYKKRYMGKTAKKAAEASANAWLEYRYGWKPLLMDADTIVGMTQRAADNHKKRLVVRSGGSLSQERYKMFSHNIWDTTWRLEGRSTVNHNCRASAGIICDVVARTGSEHLLDSFGLRPRDLAVTAWELIPFSFVVDWFVNVGPWLQALSPVPGIDVRGHWITTVENITTQTDCSKLIKVGQGYPSGDATGVGGSSTLQRVRVTRQTAPAMTFTPIVRPTTLSTINSLTAVALSAGSILNLCNTFRR